MSVLHTQTEGDVVIEEMQPGEVEALLDDEAHQLLGISGPEFAQRWAKGEYLHADNPRITDLAILLP
jgi:hypothetical protein